MTEYVEDVGLNEAVAEVMNNQQMHSLSDLRKHKVKLIPLLKVKTNKEGEHQPCTGKPASCKKVSDLHRAAGIDAHYLLVMDYYAFNHPKGVDPSKAIAGYIHDALMSIEVTETDEGSLKFSKRDPDIVEYSETISEVGLYHEGLKDFSDVLTVAVRNSAAKLATGDLDDAEGTPARGRK